MASLAVNYIFSKPRLDFTSQTFRLEGNNFIITRLTTAKTFKFPFSFIPGDITPSCC